MKRITDSLFQALIMGIPIIALLTLSSGQSFSIAYTTYTITSLIFTFLLDIFEKSE